MNSQFVHPAILLAHLVLGHLILNALNVLMDTISTIMQLVYNAMLHVEHVLVPLFKIA